MNATGMTCELVDERDLDTRYLAGQLSPAEAEAFEAHFFDCGRCWDLVRQGLEIRSAFQADSPARSPVVPLSRSRRAIPRWWGLAAAAIAAVGFGIWWIGFQPDTSLPEDVFRGDGASLQVAVAADSAHLTASWPRVSDADVYRIRLYGADGMLALQRETTDTSISVPVGSIPQGDHGEMFWQIQALDRLRNSVAGSDLTRVVIPDP
jgi:hypothetical protein